MKEYYKDKDILKMRYEYPVDPRACDEETLAKIRETYDIDEDCMLMMTGQDIEDLDVPYDAVDWSWGEEIEGFDEEIIKPANHYLVFAQGVRWNGASGYTFAKTFGDALYRDYDHTMYIKNISKHKKAILFREHSHDVPMGNPTVVIALTDREYDSLKDREFSRVEEFAQQYM